MVRTRRRREELHGRLLVSPTLLVVGLVVLAPFAASVVLAFQDVRLIDIRFMSPADLGITFDNFAEVLSSAGFWEAARTTVVYASLTTVGSVLAGLVLALALRRPFPGRGAVRGLMLVPYVLPVVAATTIWTTLLNPQYGAVNEVGRRFLGWEAPINFLTTRGIDIAGLPVPVALSVVIAFEVWKSFPLAFLFITARLQAAPRDIEEAAIVDGASPTQCFRHVLLPQLTGVLALLGLLRFIWSFQNFNDVYLLTGGAGGTEVVAVRVYEELITRADIGAASALGLLMTLALSVLLLAYVRMTRKEGAR
ncbi:multiple sugar transport system permease protein [Spinactinospora alkalitolerans]|uniref:Multiple sugar transport system permease protein n=1 Tax=Spinactinospora alkalitolerans TaxID=687207 RepID=A0A852TWT2_9ACTN|nr:sugar ABC transporter permease [Spinactinospora alkalitolerans]NYE48976.1 multiple sugar transport system permease protein [Spinactinospora alkalitolerans]